MKKQTVRDSSVGFVLFIATLIAMAGLFLVGNGQGLLTDQVEYRVLLDNAGSLRTGAKAYLSGVPVGTVSEIDFSPDLKGDKVLVKLMIGRQYAPRIGESSVAWLNRDTLMSEQSIHVSLRGQSAELPPGSVIPYRPRAMLDDFAGEGTTETTVDLLETVMSILKDFQEGEGSLGQLLKNPELYDNLNSFTAAMKSATEEVEKVSREVELMLAAVRSQRGTLGKLIYSESYAREFEETLKNTDRLIARLERIVGQVESGSGSLGKLLSSDALHDQTAEALQRVSRVARSVELVLRDVNDSDGVVGRLLREEDLGDSFETLLGRLTRSAGALETILEKVERGEGSIGMLVQDPSIAGSLRDLFLGVKELGYVENLVRNAEKEGRDLYLQAARLNESQERELIRIRNLARLQERGVGPPPGPDTPEGDAGEEGSDVQVVPAAATENGEKKGEEE